MMYQCAAPMNMNMNNVNMINAKTMASLLTPQQQPARSNQKYSNKKGMNKTQEQEVFNPVCIQVQEQGQEHSKMSSQFAKTQMCKFNLLGACSKGPACIFAHSDAELKQRPDLSRTRLCREFLKTGKCKNPKTCTFAHNKEELRATDHLHKTKLCRFWGQGHCTLGEKCRFAHSVDELKDQAEPEGMPQQQDQQYHAFNKPPMQAPYPVALQHPIMNGRAVPVPAYALAMILQNNGSPCNQVRQQSKDRFPGICNVDEMELTRGLSKSTEDSDGGRRSFSTSTMSDCDEGSWEPSGPEYDYDSYESRTPDFPENYGEGQGPVSMVPLPPALLFPLHQVGAIANDRGNAIGDYTGHVEIMQAPMADETSITAQDDNWQANNEYQVKNTFISVKDEPTYYPLRCIRTAEGRLTELSM